MEVNNNNEINKMFGTENEPATEPVAKTAETPAVNPAQAELQTSPLGDDATPEASPFQNQDADADAGDGVTSTSLFGMEVPESDNSNAGDFGSSGENATSFIGNHDGFGFVQKRSVKAMAVIVPLILVIGFALGVFSCYAYFFGLNMSSEKRIAASALELVDTYSNKGLENTENEKNITFTKVFVNNKTTEYECMVFAIIEESSVVYRNATYHVIIGKDGNTESVFSQFDPEQYDALIQSGDDGDRIQAQILLNRHFDFERNLEEIQSESQSWVSINPLYLRVNIFKK